MSERGQTGKEKRLAGETRSASTEWGDPIKVVYTADDVAGADQTQAIGMPGEFPFTRGAHASMYRGQMWTMRQYAGLGTGSDTNERFKFLLRSGQTGLSVAFDLPTQLGYDSDDPDIAPEVGRVGVAVDTLADMEDIFDGIPLDRVTTSFTINATAPIIIAMYAAVAEEQGVPLAKVGGTLQNEPLKDFIARGTYIFPVEASLTLATDVIQWCTDVMPRMNPISLSSVHIQQAGANIVEELAFTFLDAVVYVERALARGMAIDDFAPRLSFNLTGKLQFFQEICKIRAARRIWARLMRERFHAKRPESWRCRVFGGLCGSVMVPEEPYNNILRMAIGSVQSALAGLQAVHITPWDEPFAIPTEQSQRLALRAQQIVAYETDITDTVDPLAGSYFVEALTNQIEQRVSELMSDVESRYGGMVAAIEAGYPQRRILDSACEDFRRVSDGERVIVGVNRFQSGEEPPAIALQEYGAELLSRQQARIAEVKSRRSTEALREALADVAAAAASRENVMPAILRAVHAYATVGEICSELKKVFGEYREVLNYV